jgi:Peptidase S46
MSTRWHHTWGLVLSLPVACGEGLRADEGMGLFTDPPRQRLKERYGFEPSDKWLEHPRKESVRFNSGGSGSTGSTPPSSARRGSGQGSA